MEAAPLCVGVELLILPELAIRHTQATFRRAKLRGCLKRATMIAEKVDTAGRHVRQIELSPLHCEFVIERERKRGLEICDRRSE